MTTSMVLESPGRWRVGCMGVLLALPVLPTLPLLWSCLTTSTQLSYGGEPFERALGNSAVVALVVALCACGLGLPIGVFNSLYDYRGRRLLLALSLLPLLTPPFLLALGWKWLVLTIHEPLLVLLDDYRGCALTMLPAAVTLVMFATIASTTALSGSQVEGARLAGGEWTLVSLAARHAAVPAILVAVLAAVLTVSDPGPARVFNLQVASSQIRISFSSLGSYALSGQQSLTLAFFVLIAMLPVASLAAPHLVAERPARQFRPSQRNLHPEMSHIAGAALCLVVLILTLFPTFGLILPLNSTTDIRRAFSELARTGLNSLLYAGGAGIWAAIMGLALAFCTGRDERLRRTAIGICLALFAIPPMLPALGIVNLTSQLPAWTDPVMRNWPTVALALGLRYFPVAALLALRSWGDMPPSLARAGGVHGVPLGRYLWRVALPLQRRATITAFLLVALLASAETTMLFLIYPPGKDSLTLNIFQTMGNAHVASSRMAALCAVQLVIATVLLALTWVLGGGDRE